MAVNLHKPGHKMASEFLIFFSLSPSSQAKQISRFFIVYILMIFTWTHLKYDFSLYKNENNIMRCFNGIFNNYLCFYVFLFIFMLLWFCLVCYQKILLLPRVYTITFKRISFTFSSERATIRKKIEKFQLINNHN